MRIPTQTRFPASRWLACMVACALLTGCALPPIQNAAGAGDLPQVESLIAAGTDPNQPNAFGWTALHNTAAKNPANATEVVKALIAAGANPDARTFDGYTPLHTAASMNRTKIAKALVEGGADPRATAPNGLTPLDLARQQGALETVKYLEGVLAPAPVLAMPASGRPRGVAVYPFSAKGKVDGALAEGLTSVFMSKLAGSPCVRIVAEDIIRDLARQQGLEQSCGTESCQIDLASQAKADVLIRGDLVQVGETYVLTTIVVDLASKKTLLSDNVRSVETELLDQTEMLGTKVAQEFVCGSE
ncbi:MAG: ankyrin repeat domain-containing protein [Chrysiogenetes bacterium]|nr:ankyrin repeat domain-containing protein [Chrysiogenetes bacterium]